MNAGILSVLVDSPVGKYNLLLRGPSMKRHFAMFFVVAISGASKEFTHAAASGGEMHNHFCPQCGSTVYWTVTNLPSMIGVAVGAMANPKYPAPVISVFEQSKHDWVQIDGAVEHFRQSSPPRISK